LIVPLYDAHGAWRSVHARAIVDTRPKSVSPTGLEVRGLIMADQWARRLLAGETSAIEHAHAHGLLVTEGVPDWLTWQVSGEHAVFGVLSGSWTQAIADRIPNHCKVTIATHRDAAGDKYAQQIKATLEARARADVIELRRWRPPQEGAA